MHSANRMISRQRGFSLVELMVAVTIGLILLGGLTVVFVNSSETNRELQRTSQQIENGRMSIDMVTADLKHAGFYGHLSEFSAAGAVPDPCETASTADLYTGLAYAVQGYAAPNLTTAPNVGASTCDDKGLLVAANLKGGSDVLVVRRANTTALAATGIAVANEVYLQSINTSGEIQIGNGAAIGSNKASGGASTLLTKAGAAAPIRKYHVHVYFVAPCSIGSGSNGVCTTGDDAIPTLKRLELKADGGALQMKVEPLVEGVEIFRVEYGVDDVPAAVNATTGYKGDATVDSYTRTPADFTSVIAAKVYILARNTEKSPGHKDTKTYNLGTTTVTAFDDEYKRQVYSSVVRLVNPAGRREIP